MILFIDEYVTVFRRKQKRCMRSVSSKHPVSKMPLLQMLRFSRRVKYYDTVYRRICYGFQTKEMYEVSFFETSSVLDETGTRLSC